MLGLIVLAFSVFLAFYLLALWAHEDARRVRARIDFELALQALTGPNKALRARRRDC